MKEMTEAAEGEVGEENETILKNQVQTCCWARLLRMKHNQ